MLLLLALLPLSPLQQIDTTVQVSRGQRLEIDSHAGDVTVRAWNRDAVRVVSDASERSDIELTSRSGALGVRAGGRHGMPASIDLEINAPAWMGVTVSGVYGDVAVSGTRSQIWVETVQGDVDVRGGSEAVTLQSVEGSITLADATGRLAVKSVNSDVRVSNSSGELSAESVNGEIALDQVNASMVSASTVNGDIGYGGPLKGAGRYSFATHNGDVTVAVAQGASAAVSVSTFNGDFESAFPVTIQNSRKGKRFTFTLGAGGAQVELESFEGTIRLVRPGEVKVKSKEKEHH